MLGANRLGRLVNKSTIFFLFVLQLLPGCMYNNKHKKVIIIDQKNLNIKPKRKNKQKTITIFIHGSILKLPVLIQAKQGCPNGLVLYKNICDVCNYKKVLKNLNAVDPENYPLEDCYTFGWCGSLRGCQAEKSSMQFYDELIDLLNQYKKRYGYTPNLRIITHSNGSRVALFLGKAAKKYNNKHFKVQELIMLACPVQYVTAKLIPQRLFRKIYSLYSVSDWVQIIAPQRYKKFKSKKNCKRCLSPFFSSRCFPDYPNLLQAKVRINNHGISHSAFLRHKFIRKLPAIINALEDEWGKPMVPCKISGQCGVLVKA